MVGQGRKSGLETALYRCNRTGARFPDVAGCQPATSDQPADLSICSATLLDCGNLRWNMQGLWPVCLHLFAVSKRANTQLTCHAPSAGATQHLHLVGAAVQLHLSR